MGVKQIFSAIFAVLFRFPGFWRDMKEGIPDEDFNVIREYAVPVIALVQIAKFPLIGVPRPAMFFAIANFLIDIAALYLLIGGASYLLDRDRPERIQAGTLTILCYSMTPVWLCELFYFTGNWSMLIAFLALSYTLVISRSGMTVLLDLDSGVSGASLRNAALFLVTVNSAVFLLLRAVMRLFKF